MSEGYLRLIPDDPTFMPPIESHQMAATMLHELLPEADYTFIDVGEDIHFFERGEQFMHVNCPSCNEALDVWWPQANYGAWMNSFRKLDVKTPCCGKVVSLNNLRYEWPAGFARFSIEVRHPGMEALPAEALATIEAILQCKLRQIYALY